MAPRATPQGNQEAFRRLVIRHQNDVAVQMRRFSRDPGTCEELVHDMFVEAYLSLQRYRGDAPWQHWLRVIAVRVGYRFWKRRRSHKSAMQLSENDWQCLRGNSSAPQLATEAADLVYRFLSQLGESDRLVITLIYLDGCTMNEAAESVRRQLDIRISDN
jgi:RNA polymerase sigma-70 factor, ECF subfamily